MNKKAFTLVELIVVITILAVLWTIAFISFQNYVLSSRDSKRTTDIKNIVKSLELSKLQTWVYPQPGWVTNITFSWATAWKQWEFNNDVTRVVRNFKEAPKDPLVDSFYAYSVTNNQWEYQLGAVLEDTDYGTSAKGKLAAAYVKGNYNGKTVKVSTWGTTYILWAPSILTSDLNETDLLDILTAKKLVYKGHQNLPASYTGTVYDLDGGFDFSPASIIAYQWDLASIDNATLVDNLQTIYTWSVIAEEPDIEVIFSEDKDLTANIILGKKPFSKPSSGSSSSSSSSSSSGWPVDDGNYWIQTVPWKVEEMLIDGNWNYYLAWTLSQSNDQFLWNDISTYRSNWLNYVTKLDSDMNILWMNNFSENFEINNFWKDSIWNLYLNFYAGSASVMLWTNILSSRWYTFKLNPNDGNKIWSTGYDTDWEFKTNFSQNGDTIIADYNKILVIDSSWNILFSKNHTYTRIETLMVSDKVYVVYVWDDDSIVTLGAFNKADWTEIVSKEIDTINGYADEPYSTFIKEIGWNIYVQFNTAENVNIFWYDYIVKWNINDYNWGGLRDNVLISLDTSLNVNWATASHLPYAIQNSGHHAKINDIELFDNHLYDTGRLLGTCWSKRVLTLWKTDLSWNNIYHNVTSNSVIKWACWKSLEVWTTGLFISWNYAESMNILWVDVVAYDSDTEQDDSFIAKINPTTGEAK